MSLCSQSRALANTLPAPAAMLGPQEHHYPALTSLEPDHTLSRAPTTTQVFSAAMDASCAAASVASGFAVESSAASVVSAVVSLHPARCPRRDSRLAGCSGRPRQAPPAMDKTEAFGAGDYEVVEYARPEQAVLLPTSPSWLRNERLRRPTRRRLASTRSTENEFPSLPRVPSMSGFRGSFHDPRRGKFEFIPRAHFEVTITNITTGSYRH